MTGAVGGDGACRWRAAVTAVTVRVSPVGVGVVGEHAIGVGGGVLGHGGGVVVGDRGVVDRGHRDGDGRGGGAAVAVGDGVGEGVGAVEVGVRGVGDVAVGQTATVPLVGRCRRGDRSACRRRASVSLAEQGGGRRQRGVLGGGGRVVDGDRGVVDGGDGDGDGGGGGAAVAVGDRVGEGVGADEVRRRGVGERCRRPVTVTVPLAAAVDRGDRQRVAVVGSVSLASTSMMLAAVSSATVAVSSSATGASLTGGDGDRHGGGVGVRRAVGDRVAEAVGADEVGVGACR